MKSLASLLLLVLSAFVIASLPGTAAEESYEINVILSLTGPLAFLGSKEADSLRALEGLVNTTGGIRGRTLKFVVADDGSNPQVSVQIMSSLIAKKVPVVLGPSASATCEAVQPLVEKGGPLLYCYSPNIFPQAGSYMFLSAPLMDDVQPVMMRFFKSRGWKRIAVIVSNNATGADFDRRLDGTIAAPEFRDLTFVAREHFNPTDITLSAQVARLKAAGPQVLLTAAIGPAFGNVLHAIRDAGLDLPVWTLGGNMTYAIMEQYMAFLPRELYMNGARGILPDPTATGAVKKAQTTYFDALKVAKVRPEFMTQVPWDPSSIVVDALRRLGPEATAGQLHEYLANLKGWAGIEGVYDFSMLSQRGIGQSAAAMFQWDARKNDFVMVFPTSRAR